MLGHGAGGGVDAPDIQTAARTALAAGWAVALVEQPYRVAGRRSPVPAPRLDAAWIEVAAVLTAPDGPLGGCALVTRGRCIERWCASTGITGSSATMPRSPPRSRSGSASSRPEPSAAARSLAPIP